MIINKVYRVRTEPKVYPPEHHYCRKGSLVVIDYKFPDGTYNGYGVGVTGSPCYHGFRPCDLSKLEFDEEINQ